jgi:uncharacterized membrane protein
MKAIFIVFAYLLFPVFILFLCHKMHVFNKIGPVILAYILGVVLGNIGIYNEADRHILEMVSMGSIPLALPLILFSSDLKKWAKMAPGVFMAMIIGLFGVVVSVVLGHFLFSDHIPGSWKISGMLIGVYSGGTPNLGAIKTALGVDDETYIIAHTYDMVISAFYLLFVITIGQRVFSWVLPRFKSSGKDIGECMDFNGKELFWGLHKKKYSKGLLTAFLISIALVAMSAIIGFQLKEKYQMAVLILLLTTLGTLLSLNSRVRKIEKTFELGMYFILVFCLAVSSLAEMGQLMIVSPYLFLYILLAVFGSLFIQVLLSYFFKIDTDTVLITSTALICSPPFVPVVAGALKNKEVLLSGIAVGIIGFVIGNYLGIAIAYLLQAYF